MSHCENTYIDLNCRNTYKKVQEVEEDRVESFNTTNKKKKAIQRERDRQTD